MDPVNNVTAESVNDHWVEITKAFKALTDEDIRKNYELYGHPDGKQSFSIGIALPKFIVTDGNGKYVLLVYAALIGVLLPYFVGKWWYGTQKMTKDGILISSAGKLFTEYREDMVEGAILGALSNGDEYEAGMRSKKSHEDSSKIETRILEGTTGGSKTTLTQADKEKLLGMEDEKRRRILSLLWAYLNRVQLDDPTLDEGMPRTYSASKLSKSDLFDRKVRGRPHRPETQRILHEYDTCFREYPAPTCFLPHRSRVGSSHGSRCIATAPAAVLYTSNHSSNL